MASNKSVHVQLEEQLRTRILNKEWEPGVAILSENEIARQYSVSRMTARSVITQLVGEGLVYRVPGKGTFVAEPQTVAQRGSFSCIREQLQQQGWSVSTRLLAAQKAPAPKKIAHALAIGEGEAVFEVCKVRSVENTPISLSTSYFPASLCPGLLDIDLENDNTCEILREHYGIVRSRIHETLESSIATFSEAESLGILPGHPLLLLWSQMISDEAKPYEYTKVLFRGDRIRLSFDYEDLAQA